MNSSLDALHPIFIPEPVGFFPLTDGYLAILVFLVSIAITLLAFAVQAFRRNRFKREALRELKAMRETLSPAPLFELLKRVALSCDERARVASLSAPELLAYFHLKDEELFIKAYDSYYDETLTLDEEDKKSLYRLTRKAIKEVRYVRD